MPDSHQKISFDSLIELGVAVHLSKMIIALWMWLESKGVDKIFERFVALDDEELLDVGLEAEFCLSVLQASPNKPTSSSSIRMPLTQMIACDDSFSIEDVFHLGRENAVAQICQVLTGLNRDFLGGDEMSGFIDYWTPGVESHRCLYMNFCNNGLSPSKIAIGSFFSREYGNDCVESIDIHKPRNGPVEWGKIVFGKCLTVAQILRGREEINFCICGHWVKFRNTIM